LQVARLTKSLVDDEIVVHEFDEVLTPPEGRRRHGRRIVARASHSAEVLRGISSAELNNAILRRLADVLAHDLDCLRCGGIRVR
jgi:hypothetical protein